MSDEVSQFLEQVGRLRDRQIEDDEVRAREREEFLAAKRERQARREGKLFWLIKLFTHVMVLRDGGREALALFRWPTWPPQITFICLPAGRRLDTLPNLAPLRADSCSSPFALIAQAKDDGSVENAIHVLVHAIALNS